MRPADWRMLAQKSQASFSICRRRAFAGIHPSSRSLFPSVVAWTADLHAGLRSGAAGVHSLRSSAASKHRLPRGCLHQSLWKASNNHAARCPRHAAARENRRWHAAREDWCWRTAWRASSREHDGRGGISSQESTGVFTPCLIGFLPPGGGRWTCGLLRRRGGLLDGPSRLLLWKILATFRRVHGCIHGIQVAVYMQIRRADGVHLMFRSQK
jgi:hypothetical protein